jgi:hypothetical protein
MPEVNLNTSETFTKRDIFLSRKPPARGAYAPEGKAIPLQAGLTPLVNGTSLWNTLGISRIALTLHFVQKLKPDAA